MHDLSLSRPPKGMGGGRAQLGMPALTRASMPHKPRKDRGDNSHLSSARHHPCAMPHRRDNNTPRWQQVRYPPSKYGPTGRLYDPTYYGMRSTTRDSTKRPSRPAERPDPDDWGRGPWPRKATKRSTTQGSYLLWVRRPWELGDDDEGHVGHRVAHDG